MSVAIVGVDLAKNIFHIHAVALSSVPRAGLGFLDSSISDKSHRSLGRIAARGDDDETTETEPFAAVQGQGGAGGSTRRADAHGTGRAV